MTFRLSPTYRYFGLAGMVALEQGTTDTPANLEAVQGKLTVVPYFWNPSTLAFEVGRQTSTGSGGGAGSTEVDASLTSNGSTKLVGQVTVANPTTAVDATLTSAGSTRIVGKVELSPTTPGSSNDYLWVRTQGGGAGSTEVDANLTSAGSTKLIGQVTVANPTTSVSLSTQITVTVGNPTTSVSLSSQHTVSATGTTAVNVANQPTVDLSSVGSTRLVGQVTVANPTTSVTVTSGVVLAAGSSANIIGAVVIDNGTTNDTVGAVALLNGSSANTLGNVAQGAGSSGNFWVVDSFAFTSGQTSRSSISTTVDTQIVAANANRRGLVIANRSTAQTVGIGYSTAAVTTALANVDVFIPPSGHISFGFQGTLPLYLGPLRGINLTSTTVAGSVGVVQFLNT